MEFSRQESWNGLPFPSPGDLPNPGIKPGSPALQVDSLSSEPPGKPKCFLLLLFLPSRFSRVRPHRRQPTRLLHPWVSLGKNTGMGCHFLLQCMHACEVTSVMYNSMRPYGQQPTRLLCPQDALGKNTGMGCHFLLQMLPRIIKLLRTQYVR